MIISIVDIGGQSHICWQRAKDVHLAARSTPLLGRSFMSSRLFRAIVGVGISLGTMSAACSGAVDEQADGVDTSERETSTPDPQPGDPAPGSDSATSADARSSLDATDARADAAADAPADAPRDVILDAFCDATWPTTKGNPAGPTCGPVQTCAEAGPAPHCYAQLGPSICSPNTQGFAAWCVGGKWECSTGAVPQDQCKCWGPLDAGQTCP